MDATISKDETKDKERRTRDLLREPPSGEVSQTQDDESFRRLGATRLQKFGDLAGFAAATSKSIAYEEKLALLEREHKGRLLLARQEQDLSKAEDTVRRSIESHMGDQKQPPRLKQQQVISPRHQKQLQVQQLERAQTQQQSLSGESSTSHDLRDHKHLFSPQSKRRLVQPDATELLRTGATLRGPPSYQTDVGTEDSLISKDMVRNIDATDVPNISGDKTQSFSQVSTFPIRETRTQLPKVLRQPPRERNGTRPPQLKQQNLHEFGITCSRLISNAAQRTRDPSTRPPIPIWCKPCSPKIRDSGDINLDDNSVRSTFPGLQHGPDIAAGCKRSSNFSHEPILITSSCNPAAENRDLLDESDNDIARQKSPMSTKNNSLSSHFEKENAVHAVSAVQSFATNTRENYWRAFDRSNESGEDSQTRNPKEEMKSTEMNKPLHGVTDILEYHQLRERALLSEIEMLQKELEKARQQQKLCRWTEVHQIMRNGQPDRNQIYEDRPRVTRASKNGTMLVADKKIQNKWLWIEKLKRTDIAFITTFKYLETSKAQTKVTNTGEYAGHQSVSIRPLFPEFRRFMRQLLAQCAKLEKERVEAERFGSTDFSFKIAPRDINWIKNFEADQVSGMDSEPGCENISVTQEDCEHRADEENSYDSDENSDEEDYDTSDSNGSLYNDVDDDYDQDDEGDDEGNDDGNADVHDKGAKDFDLDKFFFSHHDYFTYVQNALHGTLRTAFDLLMKFLSEEYSKHHSQARKLLRDGRTNNRCLNYLFAQQSYLIVQEPNTKPLVVRQEFGIRAREGWTLGGWTVSHKSWVFGTGFFQKSSETSITPLDVGEEPRRICELPIFPLKYADAETKTLLQRRAQWFFHFERMAYIAYEGWDVNHENLYNEARFVIDMTTYWNMHGTGVTVDPAHLFFKESFKEYGRPTDIDVIKEKDHFRRDSFAIQPTHFCVPLTIYGFDLQEKRWKHLYIDNMAGINWDDSSFKSLAIDQDSKLHIEALVSNKIMATKGTDYIVGKGNGLVILLHGSPGTGKTLTAESVAEIARKPLYRVTCGDIGVQPREVEEYLSKVFHLGKTWDCIVLLDEADVFLEERSLNDLGRNALVSVFLRTLEYYDGILILTSNRVGIFDEAFKSRIQLALHYPKLDRSQRKQIWTNFIQRISGLDKGFEADTLLRSIDELAAHEMNGRQIRNAITTARQLALFRREPFNIDFLRGSIKVSSRFDQYLHEVKNRIDDEEMARDNGTR